MLKRIGRKTSIKISVLCGLWLLLSGYSLAAGMLEQKEATDYNAAFRLTVDESWSEAITRLTAFISSFPHSSRADDAHFWICYCRDQLGALEESYACYQDLIQARSRSEWRNDARRNMANLSNRLAAQGKSEYRTKVDAGVDSASEILSVVSALANIGDEASVQIIIDQVDRVENPKLRGQIVGLLGRVRSELAVEKLREIALGDSSPNVRRYAIRAFGNRKTDDRLDFLRRIAVSDQPTEVRQTAIDELGDIRTVEVVKIVERIALNDADERVAAQAAHAIGETRRPEAQAALEGIYRSQRPVEVRRYALDAMGDLRTEPAYDFLLEVARQEVQPDLGSKAVESLARVHSGRIFLRPSFNWLVNRGVGEHEKRLSAVSGTSDPRSQWIC